MSHPARSVIPGEPIDGDSAFEPIDGDSHKALDRAEAQHRHHQRDLFAAHALAGLAQRYAGLVDYTRDTARDIARCAYALADAMLAERERGLPSQDRPAATDSDPATLDDLQLSNGFDAPAVSGNAPDVPGTT